MLFIVNPSAARGRALRDWIAARRELVRLGVSFEFALTERPGDAIGIARRALRAGEDRLVAVGGDGTLNEVVNGYFDEAGRAINGAASIGLLPSGTGSDFRRTLGLRDRDDALHTILRGETQALDLIHVELRDWNGQPASRFAVNLISFGLGGETVARVNAWREQWPRWIGGYPRFAIAALQSLRRYRNRRVTVRFDGAPEIEIASNFLVVANGRFAGGGMMFAPNADPFDGRCDVVLTDGASRWDIVRELPRISRGAHLRNPKVSEYRAASVEISGDDALAVDIDGETAGWTPARLSVIPAALRFIVKTRS